MARDIATNETAPGRPFSFFTLSFRDCTWEMPLTQTCLIIFTCIVFSNFFYSIQVAEESCNFSNILPEGTSQFYPCTHHESIFRIHNFCSECMHSELANLAGESITFLTISYFSVEKNSNSAVGHSNQHHPVDHSSNKLLLVFQLYSQRNQFFQFQPSQLHELLSA